ncbi:hypothetical protein B0H34DRAFT_125701 [Crassisporium funariophilum]|nr:hypothetical protein B0H34DRAFT_125701 [Crassisporium funariophilum]
MGASSKVTLLFGPLLIGVILNTLLYGVAVVQCFIYYQTYRKDAKWIRYFVLYLFVIETANTIMDIGLIFEPLVLNYGEPEALTNLPKMLIPDALVNVMISTPVQFFIAWRIKMVGGSWVMPIIIGFFGTCSFIGGLAATIGTTTVHEWAGLERLKPAVITSLVATATADVLITTSLSWTLLKRKSGVKSTDDKVARIIRLTVQTGFITSLFALLDVITFTTLQGTAVAFTWDLALSKLYTNSILSTLNARAGWNNLTGSSEADSNVLFGPMTTKATGELSRPTFNRNENVTVSN